MANFTVKQFNCFSPASWSPAFNARCAYNSNKLVTFCARILSSESASERIGDENWIDRRLSSRTHGRWKPIRAVCLLPVNWRHWRKLWAISASYRIPVADLNGNDDRITCEWKVKWFIWRRWHWLSTPLCNSLVCNIPNGLFLFIEWADWRQFKAQNQQAAAANDSHYNFVYGKIASIALRVHRAPNPTITFICVHLHFRCFRSQITYICRSSGARLSQHGSRWFVRSFDIHLVFSFLFLAAVDRLELRKTGLEIVCCWSLDGVAAAAATTACRASSSAVYFSLFSHVAGWWPMRACKCYDKVIFRINWSARPKYTSLRLHFACLPSTGYTANVLLLISAYFFPSSSPDSLIRSIVSSLDASRIRHTLIHRFCLFVTLELLPQRTYHVPIGSHWIYRGLLWFATRTHSE